MGRAASPRVQATQLEELAASFWRLTPVQVANRESSFAGSLLGLALGDAFGAPLEGGPLEQAAWRLMGSTPDGCRRWTDDTLMALDLAESLTARGTLDQDDLAQRFARSYCWSRGYGPGAARLLKLIRKGVDWRQANTRVFSEGSFGNGGAMRAPVVGLFYWQDFNALVAGARASAVITHAHPLGQQGAVLVALATALALENHSPKQMLQVLGRQSVAPPLRDRLEIAAAWMAGETASPDDVRTQLGNGIVATESCVTSIYVAFKFIERPFGELLDFVAVCGGDVDTIGAMAGAIWGARNGDAGLPDEKLACLESGHHVRQVAINLYQAALAVTQR